jgi:hypothetical protein
MFCQAVKQSFRHVQQSKNLVWVHGIQHPAALRFAARAVVARNFSVQDYPTANPKARALKTSFNLFDPATAKDGQTGKGPFQLTKIVATIGPTSEQEEPLKKVVNAGMKIMRLNFSHATKEEVELRLKNLALSQVRPIVGPKCNAVYVFFIVFF